MQRAQELKALAALLDEGLDLTEPERALWLEALQGDAAAQAPLLRELFARHELRETNDLLERGPMFSVPRAPELAAGVRVGPYQLLSRLGSGGMGEVWLAERADVTLARRVALKLPHTAWGRGLAERFARERRILSALEHQHIARLYDAGFDELGRPYMALEFVEGLPIDVYCRQHGLGIDARLRLLLQVADAVAFAHSRLVVHRDLKPGNILVTAAGQVRLLDFGIAKLLQGDGNAEQTSITQEAGRALTLDYASPEQIRGEPIGTASDVYSLGVVAYEVLAGARPYRLERTSAAALEEAIVAAAVPLASIQATDTTLRKQLRGDLDATLNQALKKEPSERYATVDALAQDWRSFLEGRRVLARPDTLTLLALRAARRYRLQLTAAALVAIAFVLAVGFGATMLVIAALLVGIGASAWQARRANEQARVARTEARTAEAVQAFLEGIFSANSGDQADPLLARQRSARELLDEGAARIEGQLDDVPLAKLRVLRILARLYDEMGEREALQRMLQRRVDVAQRAFGERSLELARSLVGLGAALTDDGRDSRALSSLTRAEAIFGQHAEASEDDRLALDLALANYYRMRGDVRGIEPARRAVERLRRGGPSQEAVKALVSLGSLEHLAEHDDLSAETFREALALAGRLSGGGRTLLPLVLIGLANAESARGRPDEADALLREGIATAEAVEGVESNGAVLMLGWRAQFLYRHDRNREAIELVAEAQRRLAGWRDAVEQRTVRIMLLLIEGFARRQFGQPALALSCLDQALDLGQQAEDNPGIEFWVRVARANALLTAGKVDAAAVALDDADAYLDARAIDARKKRNEALRVRIALLLAQDRPRDAEATWQLWPQKREGLDIDRAAAQVETLLALGELAQADAQSTAALQWINDHPGMPGAKRVQLQVSLVRGTVMLAQQRVPAAIEPLRSAFEVAERIADASSSPDRLRAAAMLGRALLAAGDRDAAVGLLSIAQAIERCHPALPPCCRLPLQTLQAALRPSI